MSMNYDLVTFISLFDLLTERFGSAIKPNILDIAVAQHREDGQKPRLWLDVTKRGKGKDVVIDRIDIEFITNAGLDPHHCVFHNAEAIMALDDFSIINCFDFITNKAAKRINHEWALQLQKEV
jgi:hypothetical protein